ncbi:MAG: DUF4239 domain-containing protein [Bdellovibrionaceae bacterium]|nr:DUF4239 domain-containing protein [Pseudobdellovibrionaceae bacterium]
MEHLLLTMPLWAILLLLLIFLPLCIWMGYKIADLCDRFGAGFSITEAIPTSILGVHALLVGFTFSMAISRYEARRELVVKEANAIGTAYLRTKTLPAPYDRSSQALLLSYLERNVQFGAMTYSHEDLRETLLDLNRHQERLWKVAQEMTTKFRGPIEALYLSALNEAFDIRNERLRALQNKLPASVLIILLITLSISIISLGFAERVSQRKAGLWVFLLSVVFAIAITLIIDLDRPRLGLIRISQAPMNELYESLRLEDESQTK